MTQASSVRWRSPAELVEIGCSRSRVVMMNEAHNGWLRCVRTRRIGTSVLPVAHAAGVRHLAMEALFDPRVVEAANDSRHLPETRDPSYLAQPEMRVLIQTALDLGWMLIGYEADMRLAPDDWDPMGEAFTNWREEQQARNLVNALGRASLGHAAPRLVREWASVQGPDSGERSQVGPDGIEVPGDVQHQGVCDRPDADGRVRSPGSQTTVGFMKRHASTLESLGGTAGFLTEQAPSQWATCGVDALLLSVDNHME